MSPAQRRQRYADDPAYRARRLAQNSVWKEANRKQVNAKRREKYAMDPEFRAQDIAGRKVRHDAVRDQVNAQQREKYATDPEYRMKKRLAAKGKPRREGNLRRYYGLSLDDYDAMLAGQDGV